MVTMVTTKISQSYFRCVKLFIQKNYMFVLAVQTEIFDTGYCWIVHLSFLTSHNLLFFRFCKTSKKTTFSVFLSFFLVKSPKSQSLKLNISRTAWPILMILVSFCRILNGLSDEINLFWRCSSPLTISITFVRIFQQTTDRYIWSRPSLLICCVVRFLELLKMQCACACVTIEGMPEPALHIPSLPLEQSKYSS